MLTDLYCTRSPRSSFLYIVWIYVDEYMSNPAAAKALMETLLQLTQCTFSSPSGPLRDAGCFVSAVDIVEDFYELIVQYIRRGHGHLVAGGGALLHTLWDRAICGLLLDHQKAMEAVVAFFTECIAMAGHGEEHRRLVEALLFGPQGTAQRIVAKILQGLCHEVSRERAALLAELLNVMYKYDRVRVEAMTKQLVAERVQTESSDPTKYEFVEQFFDHRNDSRFRHKHAMEWFDANARWKQQMTF